MSVERWDALTALAAADAELAAWMAEGRLALLEGADLATALDLRGGRAIRDRDHQLAEIAAELAPGASVWRQAAVLSHHVRRALQDRARSDIGDRVRCLAIYGNVPRSHRQLLRILTNKRQMSLKTGLYFQK